MALRQTSTAVQNPSGTSHEMDPELKAYIYQHLMDIQPYLLANAQVAVLVQRAEADVTQSESDELDYVVTLVATLNEGRMEAEGQNADIYEAFNKAKDVMIHQLAEVQNSMMDPAEREVEVRAALDGTYTLH
jgi:ribosome-associated translation inhibitor RaiA